MADTRYEVIGLYGKDINNITDYQMRKIDDGSQGPMSKDRVIYLIGKGLVTNMRLLDSNNELKIRGKGINLNTLPIKDPDYKTELKNTLLQYKLRKIITQRESIVGYELLASNNKIYRFSNSKVVTLGEQRLITNIIVKDKQIIGKGFNIDELPRLIVKHDGTIIDPNENKNEVIIRAIRMKRRGVLTTISTNYKRMFKANDFMLCRADGKLDIVEGTEFIEKFKEVKGYEAASCDYCLDKLKSYTVEVFGTKPIVLTPSNVLTWSMAKHI